LANLDVSGGEELEDVVQDDDISRANDVAVVAHVARHHLDPRLKNQPADKSNRSLRIYGYSRMLHRFSALQKGNG